MSDEWREFREHITVLPYVLLLLLVGIIVIGLIVFVLGPPAIWLMDAARPATHWWAHYWGIA